MGLHCYYVTFTTRDGQVLTRRVCGDVNWYLNRRGDVAEVLSIKD